MPLQGKNLQIKSLVSQKDQDGQLDLKLIFLGVLQWDLQACTRPIHVKTHEKPTQKAALESIMPRLLAADETALIKPWMKSSMHLF